MKLINFFSTLMLSSVLLFTSCKNSDSQKISSTETKESANEKLEAVTPDFRNYPQYVSCKINGQPYVAYYAENHITGISNSLNIPSQVVFHSSADQVKINGDTKISEIDFSFYKLTKESSGTLTSNKDFRVDGYTMFPEGGKLVQVGFETVDGQQLTITSFKDGLLEGTFSFEDKTNPARIVKITDGVFKFQQEGKTNLQYDKNGDVNMDSLLKSIK